MDSVEVTILVDGYVHALMAGDDLVRRTPIALDLFERAPLHAERSYALLLTDLCTVKVGWAIRRGPPGLGGRA